MIREKQKPIVVVGGGISGVTAAIELAEAGREVILVEEQPYLGGNVAKMNNYFPKLCPPSCGLEINFRRIRQNPRIKIFTSSVVIAISGEKGDFRLQVKTASQLVKNCCTACGECVKVCPEERPDAFNYNFSNTKAIFLPHEMAFPMKYSIDELYCRKEACSKCVEVCPYDAIDFRAKEELTEISASAIVVATGWHNYNAGKLETMNYNASQDIVTNVEFERLLAPNGPGQGTLHRPSDKAVPKEIVFVQCAGSRDENYLPYCSAVCCSASLKHALTIRERLPDCIIRIFYIDLRVSGRNEDFLNRVKEHKNILLIKGKVGKVEVDSQTKKLIVEAEDILKGVKEKYNADMVVLATGIVPNKFSDTVALNEFGFMTGDQQAGIFAVSCSKKPMDVSSSVKEATAAAMKAIQ
ncbi:MAG: CoB--CoM heterodisulfide reductase iron-sulfur subunit A family protein [Bacteroidales bacterium]|nr:CoB--CoM heterodisulfide reductase iron-sulfur subunit A family protein [Bacteroidales bacterium]